MVTSTRTTHKPLNGIGPEQLGSSFARSTRGLEVSIALQMLFDASPGAHRPAINRPDPVLQCTPTTSTVTDHGRAFRRSHESGGVDRHLRFLHRLQPTEPCRSEFRGREANLTAVFRAAATPAGATREASAIFLGVGRSVPEQLSRRMGRDRSTLTPFFSFFLGVPGD